MLARVRWSNVAAVLGAALLLVLVVAWPLLEPRPPELPEGPPRVVVTATPTPEATIESFERQVRLRPKRRAETKNRSTKRRGSPNNDATKPHGRTNDAIEGGGRIQRRRKGAPPSSAPPVRAPAVAPPVATPAPVVVAPAPVVAAAPEPQREFGGFER